VPSPCACSPGRAASTRHWPSRPLIQASGTQLFLNGSVYRFTGVDAYEAGTQWSTNAGCGGQLDNGQLDRLFASLAPDSLVRIWAFQGTIATDKDTHLLDWGPLDRVLTAAAAHHQRVILALTDQGGTCDGDHWQDPSWFGGGYTTVFDSPSRDGGRNLTPLSYLTFVRDIVVHFRDAPGLGMWEPISEAEASTCAPQYQPLQCSGHQTCPDEATAASALRTFFDAVGEQIHALDPRHLVESGFLGGGQCGTQGADYRYVSASPGIDVLSYHYYWGTTPLGGDRWNGLTVRLAQSTATAKPIIAGEAGLKAGPGAGCRPASVRNEIMTRKEAAQFRGGSSGLLVWNWVPAVSSACSYGVAPDDPLMQAGGAVG
jgi:hypothetical protein